MAKVETADQYAPVWGGRSAREANWRLIGMLSLNCMIWGVAAGVLLQLV